MDDQRPPASTREEPATPGHTLNVSALLRRALIDAGDQSVGRRADVIVRLAGADYPVVTGLVVDVRGRRLFVPAAAIVSWDTDRLKLASPKVDLRAFERRNGEVLIKQDVLGHRLLDVAHARLIRAYDVHLSQGEDHHWQVSGIDVHPVARLHLRRRHEHHAIRDWREFEPLIGETSLQRYRGPRAWLRRLKPAEIADVLENASDAERTDILNQVHGDPELEADVFEQLDDGRQSEMLARRSDAQAAEVLSRMQADDAADAIMELAPERRQAVLDHLSAAQRSKVMLLLGYHAESAGGLMGLDFLGCDLDAKVSDALAIIRAARLLQSQALTSVYCTDHESRLMGVATVIQLLQADPSSSVRSIADHDPVRVSVDADIVELTLLMADHNLLTLPVVDEDARVVGLITVDDILEATIPENWRRREPLGRAPHAQPADHSDEAGRGASKT